MTRTPPDRDRDLLARAGEHRSGTGHDRSGRRLLDSLPAVTDDEATELMTYHLQMAAIYYKNTPEDDSAVIAEMERIIRAPLADVKDFVPDSLVAARSWLAAISLYHAELKRKYPDDED